jgi:2-polyprenyl-3-methyl-5-hydroxy-6-metoxy-1,4-benzoquinol methylase
LYLFKNNMETLDRKTNWNILDRFLSHWRSKFIVPYLTKESIVCDVGCGQEGRVLCSISDYIKEGYGFDFNLKSKNNPKENIFLSDEDFLLNQKKFDVIILLAVLEHLEYPQSVENMLKNIFERLNSGGVFIMTTPDKKAKKILELLAFKLHLINEEEISDHKHYYNKNELINFMGRVGFKDVTHRYFQLRLNNLIVCKK